MIGRGSTSRVGYLGWHKIVWTFGGRTEQIFFVLSAGTAYVFLPSAVFWIFFVGPNQFPFEFGVTVGIALYNISALYFDTFTLPLYTAESWRELVRRGYFQPDEGLAAEYLTYLERVGGRLPGAAKWAALCWAFYYGSIAASVVFGLTLLPFLGWLTPLLFLGVDFPLLLAIKHVYKSEMPIPYGRPDPSGFSLSRPIYTSPFTKG